MDAVILAAGRGQRLRPLTDSVPKPLIPVAGRGPLLRLLDRLPPPVDRIVLIVGHLGDQIRAVVGNLSHDRPVVYLQQWPLDGTGGALRQARPFVNSEPFLVVNGDDLYDEASLLRLCQAGRGALVHSQVLPRDEQTWQVRDGQLTGITLTPAGSFGMVNAGAYLLGYEWFATEPAALPGKNAEWSLPHGLVQILDRMPHRAVEASFWMPCGTFAQIEEAERVLAEIDLPSNG